MAPSAFTTRSSDATSHIENLARTIMTRNAESEPDQKTTILLVVLGLSAFFLGLVTAFITYRRRQMSRRMSENDLADYQEAKLGMYESTTNLNGMTISTTHNGRASTILIRRDSNPMLANPNSPPNSPDNVPEIHITVPDEVDERGQSRGTRVLVVRVGDNATVGLEPMSEEQLPPYQKVDKNGFSSIDMDQIGGLKEKDRS